MESRVVIISKTPLRIPFAGGLTDLRRYASRFGGATCSAAIDRYIYVVVKDGAEDLIDLRYRDVHERVTRASALKHDLTREAVLLTGMGGRPLEIHILADLHGESGLGSSGALAVGLLHALHAFRGGKPSPEQLAAEAARLEIDVLGGASGYHDPAVCAFGGVNLIEYDGAGVTGRRAEIPSAHLQAFQERLLVFYTGIHCRTNPSLHLLDSGMEGAFGTLHEMKELAYAMYEALRRGDADEAGRVLHAQQEHKISLPGLFSGDFVQGVMRQARELGLGVQIPGGKVGGYLLVYCASEQHKEWARKAFGAFREIHLGFEGCGTTVVTV